jgi:hypothetical protein
MIARALAALARRREANRGIGAPGQRRDSADHWPAFLPAENPLHSAEAVAQRQSAALAMMDDEVYGYLLLTINKEPVGPRAQIRFSVDVHPSWWPALGAMVEELRNTMNPA